DPEARGLAAFFLGPFWRQRLARQGELKSEIERLKGELETTRKRVPPPGAVGKLRWLAGLVKERLQRASEPGAGAGRGVPRGRSQARVDFSNPAGVNSTAAPGADPADCQGRRLDDRITVSGRTLEAAQTDDRPDAPARSSWARRVRLLVDRNRARPL